MTAVGTPALRGARAREAKAAVEAFRRAAPEAVSQLAARFPRRFPSNTELALLLRAPQIATHVRSHRDDSIRGNVLVDHIHALRGKGRAGRAAPPVPLIPAVTSLRGLNLSTELAPKNLTATDMRTRRAAAILPGEEVVAPHATALRAKQAAEDLLTAQLTTPSHGVELVDDPVRHFTVYAGKRREEHIASVEHLRNSPEGEELVDLPRQLTEFSDSQVTRAEHLVRILGLSPSEVLKTKPTTRPVFRGRLPTGSDYLLNGYKRSVAILDNMKQMAKRISDYRFILVKKKKSY